MIAPARFDRLARAYRWMEYLSFGPLLERCRRLRLQEMAHCRRALVYGDGDGRFLARLVEQSPAMKITAIDASSRMLACTARRLPPRAQVTLRNVDALTYEPEDVTESCDLVVSHFFLDCFSESEVAMLVARVRTAVTTGAVWIVSDFALPEHRIARPLGSLLIRGLYLTFGLLTGLRARRLPDHAGVLRSGGWVLEDRQTLLAGLLASERWRFRP